MGSAGIRCDVYGVSDWPESLGERFLIFKNAVFESDQAAIEAARKAYAPEMEVLLENVRPA